MVTERSLQVLHAIVTDYVAAGEPVGSKSLVAKHPFGVSAATIRNDMVALEEAELISAPHTSSGRIPTDKGFRLYVDTLTKVQPLSAARRAAIERFLGEAHDLDEAMGRTVRLLSQLTNQVAMVQYPSQSLILVRHIDLIPIADNRVLVVLITGAGTVTQQLLVMHEGISSQDWLAAVRDRVSALIVGRSIETAVAEIDKAKPMLLQLANMREQTVLLKILESVSQQLGESQSAKLAVAGTANLSRQYQNGDSTAAVLDALEEQVTLLQLFNEMAQDNGTVQASIGRENEPYGLHGTAIVAASFDAGQDAKSKLGVLGPVNMDYANNIAAVRAVARYLSKVLGS